MKDNHLDPELMAAILEGEAPSVELVGRAWRHLLALCPQCRQAFRTFQRRRPAADYRKAFAKLRQILDQEEAPAHEERQQVGKDLAALLALPAGRRVRKVERARKRFRSPQLAEALLAESRKHLPGQPREALDLARTAKAVLFSSQRPERVADQWPRILAHLGNAIRASQGDLHEAEEHFREARRFHTLFGGSDPLVAAEMDDLEASLRRDQRRFAQAEKLLHRATDLYERLGEAEAWLRCLIKEGILHNQQGESEKAVETARKALALLPAVADPRLTWCAVHSLAVYLCDADRPAEARKVLESNRSLYEPFSDAWSRLRLRWLEGKIAAGLGEEAAAEEAFLATRDGFLREGLPYDAAAVSLELARLYARPGTNGGPGGPGRGGGPDLQRPGDPLGRPGGPAALPGSGPGRAGHWPGHPLAHGPARGAAAQPRPRPRAPGLRLGLTSRQGSPRRPFRHATAAPVRSVCRTSSRRHRPTR